MVTLDIDGSVQKINAKLQSTRDNLVGVAEGYEQIGEASKKAVAGATSAQDNLTASTKKTQNEQSKLGEALKKGNKEQDKFAKSTKTSSEALKKQGGLIENLQKHLKRLEEGQRKANNLEDLKKYNTEIAKTRAALASLGVAGVKGMGAVNTAAKASTGVFKGLRATLATTFAPLFAAGAAVAGVKEIINTVTEYEQIAADLSAITGANGDTLEFLKQSAVEVGLETTVSAAQTLEAYKLIASAKPELLSNAEGLAEITREAVSLTEAMGGDLPTAATNLTDIMNQFNAPAGEASRFVNALAAGSKEGSADVGQLAASFLVAGTELRSSNVQFEEGVGLLEVLAENGRKGAEAGTGLRNVLSKLSATELLPKEAQARLKAAGVDMDALSDKSLSFTDRLRALAPVQNDANALTAVFGLENKAAAAILIENVESADRLTKAVTDTNVAYEQAATRTSTASGEFAKLKNTITALVTEGGDGLGGLLAVVISFVRQGLLFLVAQFRQLKPAFDPVIDAVRGLFSAIGRLLPATKDAGEQTSIWGKIVKVVTTPLRLFFVLLSNGINIITSVINGLVDLVKRSPALSRFFTRLKNDVSSFFDFFISLPALVRGALAAIRTFVVETAKSIGRLGDNIGNVLKEAFDFKKLFTEGTGDLNDALGELLQNPFEGVGTKASEAFTKEFNAAQKPVEVPLKIKPENGGDLDLPAAGGDGAPTPTGGSPVTPFVDPDKAARDAEKRAKEEEKRAQDIARTKLAAMQDGVEKELALEEARFTDLITKLNEYGLDSSEAIYQNELNKFQIKQKFLADAADLEGLSGEERINFLYTQTKAEIDAIESALKEANGGELIESQAAQINLLRKKASEEYLKQLEELQSKETQAAQKHEIALLELRTGEFDSIKDFEEFKQEEILKIRLKYAEAQLAILEKVQGAESDAALSLRATINSIRGELENLEKTANTATDFNIFELIGLDPDDPKNKEIIGGIETAAATTVEVLKQVNEVRLQSAEEAIKAKDEEIAAIDEQIEAKEGELETQEELAEQGFANNAETVRKEIELLQQQKQAEKIEREKALAEKKKIQKQQAIIDTVTQATSLITAAAQVFQSVAAIPFAGPVIGAALVAAMIGSFIAAKAKVFQSINSQKAERGATGVIKGKRHSQGGENLGFIEAEKGERFGILSRGATRRYGDEYEAFTNAANRDDRSEMAVIAMRLAADRHTDRREQTNRYSDSAYSAFARANYISDRKNAIHTAFHSEQLTRKEIDRSTAAAMGDKEAKVIQLQTEVNASLQNEELKENNRLLREMLKNQTKPEKSTEYSGDRKIMRSGNSTRIVKRRKHG